MQHVAIDRYIHISKGRTERKSPPLHGRAFSGFPYFFLLLFIGIASARNNLTRKYFILAPTDSDVPNVSYSSSFGACRGRGIRMGNTRVIHGNKVDFVGLSCEYIFTFFSLPVRRSYPLIK